MNNIIDFDEEHVRMSPKRYRAICHLSLISVPFLWIWIRLAAWNLSVHMWNLVIK